MARHAPVAPIGQYQPFHVNAAQAVATPIGQQVNTTSTTPVAAPGSVAITPASMANISVGMALVITGGTGTPEVVPVIAVSGNTFTATFANTHSGTYTIRSANSVNLGAVVINQVGTAMALTLYNGDPALASQFPNVAGYGVLAAITPTAGSILAYGVICDYGLFYTYSGTAAGDVTITYIPNWL